MDTGSLNFEHYARECEFWNFEKRKIIKKKVSYWISIKAQVLIEWQMGCLHIINFWFPVLKDLIAIGP